MLEKEGMTACLFDRKKRADGRMPRGYFVGNFLFDDISFIYIHNGNFLSFS